MGSEFNQSKPRYDFTMSKRTRKAFNNPQVANANADANENSNRSIFSRPQKAADDVDEENESENQDRKSLKQLINGDETTTNNMNSTISLGRHFSEEEPQLKLVKKPQQCNNGAKLKGIVSRYAKVFSQLVKGKREPGLGSKKKQLLRLSNVG